MLFTLFIFVLRGVIFVILFMFVYELFNRFDLFYHLLSHFNSYGDVNKLLLRLILLLLILLLLLFTLLVILLLLLLLILVLR
jgi:hypothetical protein